MKSRSIRTLLMICLLAMTVFAAQPTYPAYAGTSPSPSPSPVGTDDFEVTGYTITRGGQPVVGSILKDEPFDVIITIFDKRSPAKPLSEPLANINTASFLLNTPYSIYSPDYTYQQGPDGWRYTIIFHTVVYTGIGNVFNFRLSYADKALPMIEKSLTFDQCVPYVPPKEEENNVVTKGTGFVLRDARYGDGGTIYAGETFSLSATILATNGDVPVENVTVSFAPPEKLTIAAGSSVTYVGTMAPGQSVPVSVSILPGANIEEGTYTIGININGVNKKTGDPVSAQATVSVPVLQPERFEIFNTQLPTDLTAGMDDGMGYASITLVNKGRGTVANVSVEIVGEGLSTDEGKQYVGNVAAGEQKSSDFNIHADTPGQLDGLVIVTYENARGEEKTIDRGFSVNVMEFTQSEIDPEFPIDDMPIDQTGPSRLILVLGIVAAAVVAAILLLQRARKKKKAKEEEAFLDDDDDL